MTERFLLLDLESSGNFPGRFPTEITWIDETGAKECFLICPVEDWTAWDPVAEGITGITRGLLETEVWLRAALNRIAPWALTGHQGRESTSPVVEKARALVRECLARVEREGPVRHRALPDAERHWRVSALIMGADVDLVPEPAPQP